MGFVEGATFGGHAFGVGCDVGREVMGCDPGPGVWDAMQTLVREQRPDEYCVWMSGHRPFRFAKGKELAKIKMERQPRWPNEKKHAVSLKQRAQK